MSRSVSSTKSLNFFGNLGFHLILTGLQAKVLWIEIHNPKNKNRRQSRQSSILFFLQKRRRCGSLSFCAHQLTQANTSDMPVNAHKL